MMKVILAAGGSGGHIFPSVALCHELEKKGVDEICFVSSRRRLDMNILKGTKYKSYHLSVNPMPRSFHLGKIARFTYNFIRDIVRSMLLVKKIKPDIVVGFGGYSSGAIVIAAKIFNVPVLIHEQNYEPGRANKILCRFADCIATSFEESEKFFSARKNSIFYAGNPLRSEMLNGKKEEAADSLGIALDVPTVLIMGGSQGASFLNDTATKAARQVSQMVNNNVQYIHLTGPKDYQAVKDFYDRNNIKARVYSFLERIDYAYAMSDVAVSRSGAAAVFELAYYGKAMILVPYPNPKNNQRSNAEYFKDRGAAIYKNEKELTVEDLAEELFHILNDKNFRLRLEASARRLSSPKAAEILACKVIDVASKNQIGK